MHMNKHHKKHLSVIRAENKEHRCILTIKVFAPWNEITWKVIQTVKLKTSSDGSGKRLCVRARENERTKRYSNYKFSLNHRK